MWNIQCSNANGKVLGMCREGFLMGVCCQMDSTKVIGDDNHHNSQNDYIEEIPESEETKSPIENR